MCEAAGLRAPAKGHLSRNFAFSIDQIREEGLRRRNRYCESGKGDISLALLRTPHMRARARRFIAFRHPEADVSGARCGVRGEAVEVAIPAPWPAGMPSRSCEENWL